MALDPSDPKILAALRIHDAALVMKGKIDVPQNFEESTLYDAATSVVWRAQRFLMANGVSPPVYLMEPGESHPGAAACLPAGEKPNGA